jgi:thioesterase domain-containing protein
MIRANGDQAVSGMTREAVFVLPISVRYSIPLVFFPAGDIEEGGYAHLIRRLDPRRSYFTAEAGGFPGADFSAAAERHAAELRADRRGPYRLAGWGDGGALAFETARELTRHGEEVDLVVVVDSPPPSVPARRYDGRVVFYRADGTPGTDGSLGWLSSCAHLRIVRLPGQRLSMTEPEHLSAVARHLGGVLAEQDRAAALRG